MQKLPQYLAKYAFREELISTAPDHALGIIVVIPAHDEFDLIKGVSSLQNCDMPSCAVEVIVVFNASENSSNTILKTNNIAKEKLEMWHVGIENARFSLYCLEENSLPKKHAGVGLARKIGMDEAIRRFGKVNHPDGIVVCFDADSQCQPNYLVEIENHFALTTTSGACSIHFEHPISGADFSSDIYSGIENYELHLRYYKNGLAYAKLPFAYHTIGSSMAVRAMAYCAQGGMNRRKAGEDFYFLQKFIDAGVLTELKTTMVVPSPRPSHRVPFGTGRAIQEMMDLEREIHKSYAFDCFELLKDCFQDVGRFYKSNLGANKLLVAFVGNQEWEERLTEIRSQSTSRERFEKRFFRWLNAFQTLKFIHFLRDNYFENKPLETEVPKLLERFGIVNSQNTLLEELRRLDRT